MNDFCTHPRTEMRWRIIGGGARVIQLQCIDCGRSVGGFASQKDKPYEYKAALAKWDDELLQRERTRAEQARDEHVLLRQREIAAWWDGYHEYMRSPQWGVKREAALERDQHLCQGCRRNRATQVHHLTYIHFKNELLFELISLCRSCHTVAHDPELRRSGPPMSLP